MRPLSASEGAPRRHGVGRLRARARSGIGPVSQAF